MNDAPPIKLCDLWERRRRGNTDGQVYLAGAIGGLKLLVFKRHDPGEDGPHWSVFVTARSERRDPPRTEQPAAPDPLALSPRDRECYVETLAARFTPDEEF